jgi:hypothetical protein
MPMKYRYSPKDAMQYQRTAKKLTRGMDRVTAEVFGWVAGVGAIGALHGVAAKTGSPWLGWFCYFLSLLLLGRINWFIYSYLGWTKHPEEIQPDGSLVTNFQAWRLILSFLLFIPVVLFAFGLPLLIAHSDLLNREGKASATTEKISEAAPTMVSKPSLTVSPEAPPKVMSTSPSNASRVTRPATVKEASAGTLEK